MNNIDDLSIDLDELSEEERGGGRAGEPAAQVRDVGDIRVELLAVPLLQGQLPE